MNSFIKQTAKDYDMDYKDVQYIYKTDPNKFYDKLEEYIRTRSEN